MAEVARQLQGSRAAVYGVQRRAVERSLAEREVAAARMIRIDKTSFTKRHEYVTVISSEERVLHVADERNRALLAQSSQPW